jgi:hypothetical protein
MALRILEGRPDNPLDTLAGVDVLVDRHLVRGTPLELTPHAHVDPLGVLPEHHEVHVPRPPPLQRYEPIRQRAARPHVGEQIVPLAHPEEDVPGVLHPGNPRVPQRSQQHRRALPLDRHTHLRRERRPVPQVAIRAQIQLPELQGEPALLPHELQQQLALADHLGADPIAPDQGDLRRLHRRTWSSGVNSSRCASATGP